MTNKLQEFFYLQRVRQRMDLTETLDKRRQCTGNYMVIINSLHYRLYILN